MPQMGGFDPTLSLPEMVSTPEEMEILDIQKNQAENIADRTIKKFASDLEVTHFTEYGPTADGIIACSKEFNADLIVIGTHKRSALERLIAGSVAEHVVRHAEVPVLVVPFSSSVH
jgi:nucleotide-binding universal stress UspA family protein